MKQSDVDLEIQVALDDKLQDSREGMARSWIVQAVMESHPLPKFEGHEWFSLCTRLFVDSRVRQAMYKIGKDETISEPDSQLTLPGFKHLRKRYSINRNNEIRIILLENMTDEEIKSKAEQYRKMGLNCLEHSKELLEYMNANQTKRKRPSAAA